MQASGSDCVAFDPFPFQQDGVASPEVDFGRRESGDALVVSQMVVVDDEVSNCLFENARQIVVPEQDAVLEGLVPAFDRAPGFVDAAAARGRDPYHGLRASLPDCWQCNSTRCR